MSTIRFFIFPAFKLQVQNAAMSAMKDEMMEMSRRVAQIAKERDYLEKALNRLQLEKLRMAKEKDDLLDNTTSRYEERLVELHSVIAELSRQVEERHREQIAEEDSEDNTDDDNDDRTVSNPLTNEALAVASRTSTDIDAQAVEVRKDSNVVIIVIFNQFPFSGRK